MTVSRVVNGEPAVLPATVARVEQAIRALGYQRNEAARRLRSHGQLAHTIGLLVDDLASPYFAELAAAVEDAARQHGCLVLIGSSRDSVRREREVIAAFCARQADGLIVVPAQGSHKFLTDELSRGTKVVCVDRPAGRLPVDSVVVDNRAAAGRAVRHLLDHGHRAIGYLGDLEDIWTVRERYQGFADALTQAGTAPEAALTRHGLRTRAEAARQAAELLALPEPPTALFAATALISMGAVDAMAGRGDVALVGFDDFALADKLSPPVTVVAQDPGLLGSTAAQLLFTRIAGDTSPPREVVLTTRLVARGSGEIRPARL